MYSKHLMSDFTVDHVTHFLIDEWKNAPLDADGVNTINTPAYTSPERASIILQAVERLKELLFSQNYNCEWKLIEIEDSVCYYELKIVSVAALLWKKKKLLAEMNEIRSQIMEKEQMLTLVQKQQSLLQELFGESE